MIQVTKIVIEIHNSFLKLLFYMLRSFILSLVIHKSSKFTLYLGNTFSLYVEIGNPILSFHEPLSVPLEEGLVERVLKKF